MEDERSFYCGVAHKVKCDLTRVIYRDTYPPTLADWAVWDCEGGGANNMMFPTHAEAKVYYESRVKHHMEHPDENL